MSTLRTTRHSKISSFHCLKNPINMTSHEPAEIEPIVDSILTPDQCECGENDHETTRFPLCRLNINNRPQQDENVIRCRCGSTTHQRITFTNCPLNRRFPQNSQVNRISNLEDIIDLSESHASNLHLISQTQTKY